MSNSVALSTSSNVRQLTNSSALTCPAKSAALSMSRSAVRYQSSSARQFMKVSVVEALALALLEEDIAKGHQEEAMARDGQAAQVQRSMGMEKDLQLNKDRVEHMDHQEAAAKVLVDGHGEAQ